MRALGAQRAAYPLRLGCAFFGLLWLPAAAFAVEARVEQVQPPGWVERAQVRMAITPGLRLQPGDTLHTGPEGFLAVGLASGGRLVLGAESEAALIGAPQAGARLIRGVLHYRHGAARQASTTNLAVGEAIQASLAQAEVWAEADDDGEALLLLDGQLQVQSPNRKAVVMSHPHTRYAVPRGQPPLPIRLIESASVKRWLDRVQPDPYRVSLVPGGRWRVVIHQGVDRTQAERQAAMLQDRGYPAEVQTAAKASEHRVVIRGFLSIQDATAFRTELSTKDPLLAAWVLAPDS